MQVQRYGFGLAGPHFGPSPSGNYVKSEDFDRILAERDALHLMLNAVEEENDRLKTELRVIRQSCPDRCEVKGSVAGTAQNYIVELEQALEKRS